MQRFFIFTCLLLGTVFFAHTASALQAGNLDPTFFAGAPGGTNNFIFAAAAQSDGKVILGGWFTKYHGVTANRITRINADGTLDTTFTTGTGADNYVYAVAIQSDDKVLFGGDFIAYNGVTVNHIARLNADGTLDATFLSGTGVNGVVNSIYLQPDGKILIGGDFTTVNGTAVNRIARLNADGTLDATFTVGTGASAAVYSVRHQSDGKILIGGDFTTVNDTTVNRIARLNADGTLDTTFLSGTGVNDSVRVITMQSDGKILIGGYFVNYNGTSINRIARLNTDGTLDTTFTVGTGINNSVRVITVQLDGKIIVGGYFTTYNSVAANRIVRINTDGTRDVTFSAGVSSAVLATVLQSDGKIIIGGAFASYDSVLLNNLTRLNTNGTLDTTFFNGTGLNNWTQDFAMQSDGKIIIGGNFTAYNGTAVNRIARLNTDGTLDTTFTVGTGANLALVSIMTQADDKILIGGDFTTINGTAINRIARLNADGTIDTSFLVGAGVNTTVIAITQQPDGKILIGGNFTSYNGQAANRIVRLNADGTRDTTFVGTGTNNSVRTIIPQTDGKILIGGAFTTCNGVATNRIARLNADGTLDTTFTIGTGADNVIYDFAYLPDSGKIVISGEFLTYNGVTVNRIARLNADGTLDTTFLSGTGMNSWGFSLGVQSDGKLLIGGNFTTYNGVAITRYITRLNTDGTVDTTFTGGTGASSYVRAVFIQPDGNILISGNFSAYNNVPVSYMARVIGGDLPSATHNLTLEVPSNLSLSCTQSEQTNDTTIEFGTLTPGTPLTQQLTCTTTTNSPNGYTLQTKRDDPDTTMDKTTDNTQNITDRTNWDPQNPNATLWQTNDTGLAFTVISSTANKDTQWWGTGTTKDDPNNKYAGFPQTAQTIVNYTQYNQNATITDIAYKLDIPTTQQAGIYDGTVTYQATVNP